MRDAYVIRVNIHNLEWNGEICTKPVQHDDCRGSLDFKSRHCAQGHAHCFFLSLFEEGRPTVRLFREQVPYQEVFDRQPPEPGDVAIFWGTYADGSDRPVGLWEVDTFDPDQNGRFVLTGRPETASRFPRQVADWKVLDNRVTRSVGKDMIRLLPGSQVAPVLDRFAADLDGELRRLMEVGRDTDPVRAALSALREVRGALPEAQSAGLTQRIKLPPEMIEQIRVKEEAAKHAPAELAEPSASPSSNHLSGFPSDVVSDYEIALRVSPLVVLAGPSGAGKTRLTKVYADEVGAEYCMIAVRPDWRANEDLLGYRAPFAEEYRATEFSRFVRAAGEEWSAAVRDGRSAKRFHVCLDEMNLARPEYYLAEVLAKMELEEPDRRLRLYDADDDLNFPREVLLSPNLSIVGTVNNDETTHALSPKVLDRAVYLTIDKIDLDRWFRDQQIVAQPLAAQVAPVLVELDALLGQVGTRVGYRVAGQVLRWVELALNVHPDDLRGALDVAVAMLVLTKLRLQRSEPSHRVLLERLKTFFDSHAGDDTEIWPRSLRVVELLSSTLERNEFAFGQSET